MKSEIPKVFNSILCSTLITIEDVECRQNSDEYGYPAHFIILKITFVLILLMEKFMNARYWQIIRDDSRRTFEVCGQITNDNAFTNKTYAMQQAGLNVSGMTPPVTNMTSSKDLIKITGYTREDGLYERLLKEYTDITLKSSGEW